MILNRVASAIGGHPKLSGFVLALSNMVPVIGVVIWDWSLFDVVAIYWTETLIIGALNVPRMALARERGAEARPLIIFLFLMHFGLFCTTHAFFVFLLSPNEAFQHHFLRGIPDLLAKVCGKHIWAFLLFFLSHLFSFFWNFIGQRKYRTTVLRHQVFQPYDRIVVLQILILFGAYACSLLGSPLLLALILIAGKTALDLGFHLFFHAPIAGKI